MVVHTLDTSPLWWGNDSTTTPFRMSCLFCAWKWIIWFIWTEQKTNRLFILQKSQTRHCLHYRSLKITSWELHIYLAEPYLNCMQNFLLCVFIPNCLPRTKNSLILKHFKRAATKYFPMNLINCSQTAKIKMNATRLNICIMVLLIKFRTITIL